MIYLQYLLPRINEVDGLIHLNKFESFINTVFARSSLLPADKLSAILSVKELNSEEQP